MKKIVLGGGCFWCIEAVFQRVIGVENIISGYAGGDINNPTYANHGTHAEVVEITYDDKLLPLKKILEIFFNVHDPTTLNQQGNDIGSQYRSIILCNNKSELTLARQAAEEYQNLWPNPIVTEIVLLNTFYPAENYHQNFYNNNKNNPYCQVIINPKIAKFQTKFKKQLKD